MTHQRPQPNRVADHQGGQPRRRRRQAADPWHVRFAREFGWRAYAIPVLLVITVWVLVDILKGSSTESAPTAQSTVQTEAPPVPPKSGKGSGPNPAGVKSVTLPTGELPAGGPYTQTGKKTFKPVGEPSQKVGSGAERTFTYVVEIEDGIDAAAYGGEDAVAKLVDATLSNPNGWIADPKFAFEHIKESDDRKPDLRIQLASLDTTHAECGNQLEMETSCFTSAGNRVLVNEARWVRGATTFNGDLGAYRQYLINHEVGHGIGYAAHTPCGEDGALAPIMMQQTLSLNNSELHKIDPEEVYQEDGKTCAFNPWPYPLGGPR